MYKIFDLNNQNEWLEIVNSFKETDVYYHPGYLKAFNENGDGEPVLFYLESEDGRVANIFMKRDIYNDERLKGDINPNTYFDISTVYGYGGPIFDAVNFDRLRECYVKEFTEFCIGMNIVSEFIRFHPILNNRLFLENIYDLANIRSTVFMDLSHGEQYIWDDLDCKCRNNIRKAQNADINVIYGKDKNLIDEFKNLYYQTMDRDNALNYYYFNENFFHTTIKELKDNSLVFAAFHENKVIAASVVIFSKEIANCHLLASNMNYQNLRPVNLLLFEVARWGCRANKKILHLGGGVSGDEDNLFRFKKTFTKTNRLSFYIGRKIYNEDIYYRLVQKRVDNDRNFDVNTDYFPKYRR